VAWRVDEAARFPETVREESTVEEAVAIKPPEEFSLNIVEEAMF
jgi:hypothetical protein